MKENPNYELKRLRALVEWYKRDTEERMTYFQHDRAQFEKRVFELTTERDRLAKQAGAVVAARALAIAVLACEHELDVSRASAWWANVVELARRIAQDSVLAVKCQRVTASSN